MALLAFFGGLVPATSHATSATWVGASGTGQNWQTATNWSTNPSIPGSAGDTATFANTLSSNTTILLNGAVTLGSLVNLDTNNEINIQNGTGGSITFDTGTTTVPSIDVSARTGGVGILLYATINGTNGLEITGSTTTALRFNSTNTDWAGFSGGLAVKRGILAPQSKNYDYTNYAVTANKVLPTDERLTLGATGTTDFNLASGRDIAVGSLAGNSNAYVYNSSTGSSFAVLAVGNDNTSGAVFAGTIGNNSGGTNGSNILHLHKIGSGTQEISGKITGPGNILALNGTLYLSNNGNNNDYTGTTTIYSGATIKIGSANALGGTAGTTTVNSGATLDLNGQSIGETISSISGTGVGNAGALINSNTGSTASLSTDLVNPGSLSIGGAGNITLTRIRSSGVFTVTKVGAGTLTTSGSDHNNLSAWDIQSGTVVLANTAGYGADRGVTLNGGTLKLSGLNSNLVNDGQAFTINSGTFDLNGKAEAVASISGGGGNVTNNSTNAATVYVGGGVSGTSSATYGGAIQNGTGTLSLTKEGSGTQTLTGTNTYTGATTVAAGVLALSGTGSIANSSTIEVKSGATLDTSALSSFVLGSAQTVKGNGVILAPTGGAVVAAGHLAPGSSVGTLSATGNVTLTGTLDVEYNDTLSGSKIDLLNVSGLFDISAATVSFADISSGPGSPAGLGGDAYIFATYGTLNGSQFAGVTNLPGGYAINYAYNNGVTSTNIALIAIPEAEAWLVIPLAVLVIFRRRR